MVVLQFVLAKLADDAATPFRELALLGNHRSVGISIFLLAILRLAWRVRQGVPGSLPMPGWQFIASRISHWFMYGLIFLLPITGWLLSSASAQGASWFNVVALPNLVAANPGLADVLEEIHEILARLLLIIALVHIAAALKHAFVDRDAVFARIASTGPIVLFVAVILAGSVALTRVGSGAGGLGTPTRSLTPLAAEIEASDLPAWNVDYGASYIRFRALQAGAPFPGEWRDWRGDLHFDEARLDEGLFDVSVAITSVESGDEERDQTLQEPAWFDSANFPEVRYRAGQFRRLAPGRYEAVGALMIKGRRMPVTIEFALAHNGDTTVLDGAAKLDRIALGLGLGEWSDIRWIGKFVTVFVHVEARDSTQ